MKYTTTTFKNIPTRALVQVADALRAGAPPTILLTALSATPRDEWSDPWWANTNPWPHSRRW